MVRRFNLSLRKVDRDFALWIFSGARHIYAALRGRARGQRDRYGRAFADRTLDLDLAVVGAHYFVDDSEPEARAFLPDAARAREVGAIERLENMKEIFFGNAHAGVRDRQHHRAVIVGFDGYG